MEEAKLLATLQGCTRPEHGVYRKGVIILKGERSGRVSTDGPAGTAVMVLSYRQSLVSKTH